jgi:hypothetical protein
VSIYIGGTLETNEINDLFTLFLPAEKRREKARERERECLNFNGLSLSLSLMALEATTIE